MMKRVLTFFGLIVIAFLTIALILYWAFPIDPEARLDPNLNSQDSRPHPFPVNKDIPAKYESAILKALSHFPELDSVNICFELTTFGAPLESNFYLPSLFGSRDRRVYRILILEEEGGPYDEVLVKNLPFDSQVAIIAHELCHTIYYERLNLPEIASWGIRYLIDPSFAQKHERSTDRMTIEKGFGPELLGYAKYVRNVSGIREAYESGDLKWIDNYYLTPAEIKEILIKTSESEIPE